MSQNSVERRDFERDLENLTIIGDPFDEDRKLSVSVLNEGSVDTEVAYIAVYTPDTQEPFLDYTPLDNMLLQPYQYRTLDGIDTVFPQGDEEDPNKYKIQLVTTRGSVFEHQYPRPIPAPKQIMKLYLGPFQFDFDQESFTYTSTAQPIQQSAWEMRDDESEITFWVKITNYGEEGIEFNGLSYILLIVHEVEDACDPGH